MEIDLVRTNLRKRLSEYRYFKIGKETSIHINAIEISLALVDYAAERNRSISKDEQRWFNAGKELDLVLRNSDWRDLADLYYTLAEHAERNYFK